jgi:hypothetical protein
VLESPTIGRIVPSRSIPAPASEATVTRFRFGVPEVVTLCLYAGLLAWAVPYHEPWADEAQAWQIVRNLPLTKIFPLLSYEGHPGLWYICLWVMSRLHLSYAGMHWVVAGIATLGVSVLLFASPFPRFIKLLLPLRFGAAADFSLRSLVATAVA